MPALCPRPTMLIWIFSMEVGKTVLERITKLGFDDYGIVDLDEFPSQDRNLHEYIAKQHHGTMKWLEETKIRRIHPKNMWPQARSAIILAMNYGPDCNPLYNLELKNKANISVYARNNDYHQLIKGRLKEIAGLLARETGKQVKVFVDTAPLMEKPLAQKANLGWQGKHTNLVSRNFGSWLFLGVILSAAKLTPTNKNTGECGSCTACLDICPTNAFPEPYKIDARLCISYLTIEYKGIIAHDLRAKMGNRIYGCDDCLAVCPWNKFAKTANEIKLQAREELRAPDLADLAMLDDKAFRKTFSRSPIKRIGVNQFLRNVMIAIGNSQDKNLKKYAQKHINADDEILREASIWAVKKLS